MRIVELAGPSGVGKSAVYKHLLEYGGFEPNPTLTYEEAEKIVTDASEKYQELEHFTAFLNYVFRTADKSEPRTFRRLSGIIRALAKIITAKVDDSDKVMIVDGGLIHRAQSLARLTPQMSVERYFELMPLPDRLFAFFCADDTLKERNKERGGDHDRSDECGLSMMVSDIGRDILGMRRCDIVTVDTNTLPPDKTARTILVNLGLVRKYDGSRASGYEAEREASDKWKSEQRIIEDMLCVLPSGAKVLDCPCGTGRFFPFYKDHGLQVIGIDASKDMIEQAGQKTKDWKDWALSVGDVRDTKLEDKYVDASVMCRLTRWLSPPDCQKALQELQRVTRQMIVFTARVRNHPHARPYGLIKGALNGWKIARDEAADGEDYRIIQLVPA